jgi:hypothetical protein
MLLVAVTVILCLSQRNCTVVMVTVSGLWLTVTSAGVLALSSATLPVPPTTAPAAAGAVAVTLKDSSIGATTLASRVGAVKVIVEVKLVVVADALGACCLMLTPAGTVHLNSALAVLVAVMLTVAAPVVVGVVVAAAARADIQLQHSQELCVPAAVLPTLYVSVADSSIYALWCAQHCLFKLALTQCNTCACRGTSCWHSPLSTLCAAMEASSGAAEGSKTCTVTSLLAENLQALVACSV